jgi:hypothetical protein
VDEHWLDTGETVVAVVDDPLLVCGPFALKESSELHLHEVDFEDQTNLSDFAQYAHSDHFLDSLYLEQKKSHVGQPIAASNLVLYFLLDSKQFCSFAPDHIPLD